MRGSFLANAIRYAAQVSAHRDTAIGTPFGRDVLALSEPELDRMGTRSGSEMMAVMSATTPVPLPARFG
jgi:hypothetical protein